MSDSMYILGINSAYHESSACLIKDGDMVAAVEEERFTRKKHAKQAKVDNPDELPTNSINFCLNRAGITLSQVDYIGFSFNPKIRLKNKEFEEQTINGSWGTPEGEEKFYSKIMGVPLCLSKLANEDISNKFIWIDHHSCHAASSFFVSPFQKAAIMSVDGIGETTTTFLGVGEEKSIRTLKEVEYPNSLGFLWEKMSKFLGFGEYDACKVMGLASYGSGKSFIESFRDIVSVGSNGGFTVDNSITKFRCEDYSRLEEIFGQRRERGTPIEKRHRDMAAGLQGITDEIALHMAQYLYDATHCKNLCVSGGVGLNCVTNTALSEKSNFDHVFVQPAANDAGTALGAAFHIWCAILNKPRKYVMKNAYLGPSFSSQQMENALKEHGLGYRLVPDIESLIAKILAEGSIVAWFQGAMEFGPRALGNRSLLADPRNPSMREILNQKVKHREDFRPFAPSVIKEKSQGWFVVNKESPSSDFMLFAYRLKEAKKGLIPAVVHVDGTSRIQTVRSSENPRYHRILSEFERITGVPILLNTSFNDDEPIVCTPSDAIKTFLKTKIDYLVLGDFLVSKKENLNHTMDKRD